MLFLFAAYQDIEMAEGLPCFENTYKGTLNLSYNQI